MQNGKAATYGQQISFMTGFDLSSFPAHDGRTDGTRQKATNNKVKRPHGNIAKNCNPRPSGNVGHSDIFKGYGVRGSRGKME
jgi:hypothetical protein